MCVCNGGQFLEEAIHSILEQSFKNFEFIIVENGSQDNSWEIIQSFDDSRIRAFQTEIRQLAFNLNFGLQKSNAKWVARMDADDISTPDRFAIQMEYLRSYPETTVLGTQSILFESGQIKGEENVPLLHKDIVRNLPFKTVLLHPTVIFNRKAVLDVGGYMGYKSEDFDLWLRLIRSNKVILANLSQPLLKYRLHPKQVRGNRLSYAEGAGYLFRDFLLTKRISYFLGFLWLTMKCLFIGR
jgi:glycosyltransferase involved in cell wall biosynthesis